MSKQLIPILLCNVPFILGYSFPSFPQFDFKLKSDGDWSLSKLRRQSALSVNELAKCRPPVTGIRCFRQAQVTMSMKEKEFESATTRRNILKTAVCLPVIYWLTKSYQVAAESESLNLVFSSVQNLNFIINIV